MALNVGVVGTGMIDDPGVDAVVVTSGEVGAPLMLHAAHRNPSVTEELVSG